MINKENTVFYFTLDGSFGVADELHMAETENWTMVEWYMLNNVFSNEIQTRWVSSCIEFSVPFTPHEFYLMSKLEELPTEQALEQADEIAEQIVEMAISGMVETGTSEPYMAFLSNTTRLDK